MVVILVAKGIYPWLSLHLISEMSNSRLVIKPMEAKEAKVVTGPVPMEKNVERRKGEKKRRIERRARIPVKRLLPL
jgi:hypothetical protein